jgi:hypothetical protein
MSLRFQFSNRQCFVYFMAFIHFKICKNKIHQIPHMPASYFQETADNLKLLAPKLQKNGY